jgi:hypothetical protein
MHAVAGCSSAGILLVTIFDSELQRELMKGVGIANFGLRTGISDCELRTAN